MDNAIGLICEYKVISIDDHKKYVEFPNCPIRLVFEDGVYVGWYYCGVNANL